MIKFFYVGFLGCLAIACTSANPDLEKAHDIHLEAIALAKELRADLMVMKEDTTRVDQADSLLVLLKEWQKSVVEVPGFDHVHEEGEHHHHGSVDVRENEQLDYQKRTLEALLEIKKNIE